MRDYSKFSPRYYTGETGRFLRQLSRDHLLVGAYVFTCPNANMLGLFYLPLPTLSHELAMDLGLAREILADLSKVPSEGLGRAFEGVYARYDESTETIFVTEMARHQLGEQLTMRDNRHKAVLKELEQWRKSPFFNDFLARYRDDFQLQDVVPNKPLQRPLQAPSKPRAGAGAGVRTETGGESESTRARARESDPAEPERPPSADHDRVIEAGSNLTRSSDEWRTVAGIAAQPFERWLGHLSTQHRLVLNPDQRSLHAEELVGNGDAAAQEEVVKFSIARNSKSLIPIGDVRARKNGMTRASGSGSSAHSPPVSADQVLEQLKARRLGKWSHNVNMAGFRDPKLGETPDDYRKAQDVEHARIVNDLIERQRKANA